MELSEFAVPVFPGQQVVDKGCLCKSPLSAHHRQIAKPTHRAAVGFTLIEMMIVVAIIAILSAMALPNYQDYLKRAKLTEAFNTLSSYRVSMEQYYQDNRNYGTGSSCGVTPPGNLFHFEVTCAPAASDNSSTGLQAYVATATAKTGSQVNGFTYTIDNINKQATTATQTGWGSTNDNCWVARRGGSCQ